MWDILQTVPGKMNHVQCVCGWYWTKSPIVIPPIDTEDTFGIPVDLLRWDQVCIVDSDILFLLRPFLALFSYTGISFLSLLLSSSICRLPVHIYIYTYFSLVPPCAYCFVLWFIGNVQSSCHCTESRSFALGRRKGCIA
jgi:hypothetical protein